MGFKQYIWISIFLPGLVACRKTVTVPEDHARDRTQLSLDSIYLYAQQTYLWKDALPSFTSFNPSRYYGKATERSLLEQEIFEISQFKLDPLTGLAYEQPLFAGIPKYSYLTDKNSNVLQSLAVLNEPESNLGLGVAISGPLIYISYVNPGSEAFKAGLERGDRILEINGEAATASLAENMIKTSSAVITYQKPGQPAARINLVKMAYENHGVFNAKLLQEEGQSIAYLALGQFSSLSLLRPQLDQAFSLFAAARPRQLILDLRYNSGGFVESAEYMANLLAGSSLNGKVMYTEHFNTLLQNGQADILKNQPYFNAQGQVIELNGRKATMADVDFSVAGNTHRFKKEGSMESLEALYFIVGPYTASASELLINSLKPYFPVKLAGSRTYGKPVGFFGIHIDQYTLYLPNFEIKNALGQGGYYSGFIPDKVITDDVAHNFGDPQEQCLSAVLSLIRGTAGNGSKSNVNARLEHSRLLGTDHEVSGMLKKNLNLKH